MRTANRIPDQLNWRSEFKSTTLRMCNVSSRFTNQNNLASHPLHLHFKPGIFLPGYCLPASILTRPVISWLFIESRGLCAGLVCSIPEWQWPEGNRWKTDAILAVSEFYWSTLSMAWDLGSFKFGIWAAIFIGTLESWKAGKAILFFTF